MVANATQIPDHVWEAGMKWNFLVLLVLIPLVLLGCVPNTSTASSPPPIAPTASPTTTPTPTLAPASVTPVLPTTTDPPKTNSPPKPKLTPSPTVTAEASIPIIDAHSQVCPENLDKVIQLMDQAGVACTILSAGVTSTIGLVTRSEERRVGKEWRSRWSP